MKEIIIDEEVVYQKRRGNNHHHNHHNHAVAHESYYDNYGVYFAYGCCIFVVLIIALYFIFLNPYYWYKTDYIEKDLHTKMAQIKENTNIENSENSLSSLSLSNTLFSLMSVYKTVKIKKLSLCHLNIYYTHKGLYNDTLNTLNQTITQMNDGDMKNYYYNPLSIKFDLTYNYDVSKIGNPQVRLLSDKRWLKFDYNITSNYAYFSTIRFLESEIDIYDQSIKTIRNIVLCSNNPNLFKIKCDSLFRDDIFAFHNEEVTLIYENLMAEENNKNTKTKENNNSFDVNNDANIDQKQYIYKQREEIMGIRIFNIIFYKQIKNDVDTQLLSTHNIEGEKPENDTINTRKSNMYDSYKEEEILTIEPNKC